MQFSNIQATLSLKKIPQKPGVYQFVDQKNTILYIGKASSLRSRLQSYFRSNGLSPKTQTMMRQAYHLHCTLTESEEEALLLENTLIKQHKPRYNILFRDDKSYPYIHLSDETYPRLSYHRGSQSVRGEYFGPFPNANAVHRSLNLLQKIFPVRQCENTVFSNRSRPCLQYQIKRCNAPCVGLTTPKEYAEGVQSTRDFLKGQDKQLLSTLHKQMEQASETLDFEKAAQVRDQIRALKQVLEKQRIESNNQHINADVVALVLNNDNALIYLAFVRNGRYLGGKNIQLKRSEMADEASIMCQFLTQHYLSYPAPTEILVSHDPLQLRALNNIINNNQQTSCTIKHNVRGDRAQWLKLSMENAHIGIEQHSQKKRRATKQLQLLQSILHLEVTPKHIECFDISHTQGEQTQASCVVFINGLPANRLYRRFKISGVTKADDYAAMQQTIKRRYQHQIEENNALPDLILIDGGKGQVNAAQNIMDELGLHHTMLLGISKGEARKAGEERFWLSHNAQQGNLASTSAAFHLLQYIRDEAHRFAISGHRKARSQASLSNALEQIKGIGPLMRQRLLTHFGTIKAVQTASIHTLIQVPGISRGLAQRIHSHFK